MNITSIIKKLFKTKEYGQDLKYFMNKAIQEKRDIFIVSIKEYDNRIEMGGCKQLKIKYNNEYNSSELKTNTGCKFEQAFLSSIWLNDKYIEKEVEYDEWYEEDGLGSWNIIKNDERK